MKSVALQDVRLSDGKEIPKGSLIAVSAHEMWEPSNYENPDAFDGYRYVKRQQDPELARTSQFASWSAEHVGFGFGKHACPGRFFVGVEAKAILAHLLLKYDFELPEGRSPTVMSLGFELLTDHAATLLVRRRKEEMEL
ncbi:Cytochrome P450 [Macrophomina phaseolina MS6]|uniref:Cytochrome P450 n=2 Tax=Macrophomina phaseolina TaxID=35725 RepID=K2R5Y4_MACPH|nr:Cytochrome P450 [Macrophomina phaseolina MS6]